MVVVDMGMGPWGKKLRRRPGIYIKLGGLAAHEERREQYSSSRSALPPREEKKGETKN
jgi:hypothetical protein